MHPNNHRRTKEMMKSIIRKLKKEKMLTGPRVTSKYYAYWAVTLIGGIVLLGEAVYNARLTGLMSLSVIELVMGYTALYMHFNWEWLLSKRSCKLCGRHIERDWECGVKIGDVSICIDCVETAREVSQWKREAALVRKSTTQIAPSALTAMTTRDAKQ